MNTEMEPLSSSPSSFSSNPIHSISMSSLGSGSCSGGGAPLSPPKLLIPGKHLPVAEPTTSLIALQVQAAASSTEISPSPMDVVSVLTTPVETPKVSSSPRSREKKAEKNEEKIGRWSDGEHKVFLEGLELHGKQWKIIAQMIGTRTVVQVRTHAQKYFQKMERANKGSSNKSNTSTAATSTSSSSVSMLTPVPRASKALSKRKSLTGLPTSSVVTRKKSRSPKKTTRLVSIASSSSLPAPPLPGTAASPPPPLELPHYMSNASSLENLSTISPTGVTDMDLGLVSSYSSSVNVAGVAVPEIYKPEPMVTTTAAGTAPVIAPPVGLDVNVEEMGDDPLEWLIDGGMNHLPESSLDHAPMFPDFSDMEATAATDSSVMAPAVQVQPKTISLLDTLSLADPKVTVQSLFLESSQVGDDALP